MYPKDLVMKRKIILSFALALIILNLSSCFMHERDGYRNHYGQRHHHDESQHHNYGVRYEDNTHHDEGKNHSEDEHERR